ncbi:dethiobiotin synthase [Antrihabitans cavernicola]|uniref:ATP-dependent dethiobiotin synthetase BioD n=1 Tax=Antrihabitans cavernicola TaxID=2495913 RepID=A0A5A7S904_9NOCA|nr:dethiobiotin synthase [Spelaeibacter cavernicola]KAA0021025.1 ATP-dependent dethiobiotin synthetase BioD [Spelaeibacter cavernicola]
MTVLVVTGTSTDVGKTVVTAALAAIADRADRRVAVCKPGQTGVAPGDSGDLSEIARLSGVDRTLELARYPEPLAPDTAARRSGLPPLTLDGVVDAVRELDADNDLTLVEGAGGLLVRLGENFTLADVAGALAAPVVVVASASLGTLNHSELTVRALAAEGLDCTGLVIGSWPARPDLAQQCNITDLPRVCGVDLVGSVPAGSGALARSAFRSEAPRWFDSSWSAVHLIGR